MDLKLIPVCSEKEHIMEYNYSEKYNCDICNHRGISYNCINCEYYRCSKCHRDILSKGGDKHGGLRVSHSDLIKIRKDEQFRIDKDGLFDWIVRTSSEDMGLYYYNVITIFFLYFYLYILKSINLIQYTFPTSIFHLFSSNHILNLLF